MDWSPLISFALKAMTARPKESAGPYMGMETPSYEAPMPVSTGEALTQGLEGAANSYLRRVPLSKRANITLGDLSDLYKFFSAK